jgi:ribonuclease VapC
MVVDSSALVAIAAGESEAAAFLSCIEEAAELRISAFNLFETRTVLLKAFQPGVLGYFDQFVLRSGLIVHPFDEEQAGLAFTAYSRYGKGLGHPAQLNLGDCAAYALAKSRDLPLLFKGNDFAHTDVRSAI